MISDRYDSQLVTLNKKTEANKNLNQFLIYLDNARIQVPNSYLYH